MKVSGEPLPPDFFRLLMSQGMPEGATVEQQFRWLHQQFREHQNRATRWRHRDDPAASDILSGDRIVCVIDCRLRESSPMSPHLFVLTATETGWDSEDGWDFNECEWWAHERDVLPLLPKRVAPSSS